MKDKLYLAFGSGCKVCKGGICLCCVVFSTFNAILLESSMGGSIGSYVAHEDEFWRCTSNTPTKLPLMQATTGLMADWSRIGRF
jgi:hypothetical protein